MTVFAESIFLDFEDGMFALAKVADHISSFGEILGEWVKTDSGILKKYRQ